MDWFAQEKYECRLEWGWRGARRAARRGDTLIIVDVLSFSTTAATAAAHGTVIYPCQSEADVETVIGRTGAERGVHRRDVPEKGRFSLSPVTFFQADQETRVALSGPNGATCCRLAGKTNGSGKPPVWLGAFVNASATARAAAAQRGSRAITVLACGERWVERGEGDGPLRFAVEDLWGAGAIIAHLSSEISLSPEARTARAAFLDVASALEAALLACGSGRELTEKGYENDVRHAARVNFYEVPVRYQNGQIIAAPV